MVVLFATITLIDYSKQDLNAQGNFFSVKNKGGGVGNIQLSPKSKTNMGGNLGVNGQIFSDIAIFSGIINTNKLNIGLSSETNNGQLNVAGSVQVESLSGTNGITRLCSSPNGKLVRGTSQGTCTGTGSRTSVTLPKCGSTVNTCSSGTVSQLADTDTQSKWDCKGDSIGTFDANVSTVSCVTAFEQQTQTSSPIITTTYLQLGIDGSKAGACTDAVTPGSWYSIEGGLFSTTEYVYDYHPSGIPRETSRFAQPQYFSDGQYARYWNGSSFTTFEECSSTSVNTYTGTWRVNQPQACSTACGQQATTKYGSVSCSTGNNNDCDPNTKPTTPNPISCSATSPCDKSCKGTYTSTRSAYCSGGSYGSPTSNGSCNGQFQSGTTSARCDGGIYSIVSGSCSGRYTYTYNTRTSPSCSGGFFESGDYTSCSGAYQYCSTLPADICEDAGCNLSSDYYDDGYCSELDEIDCNVIDSCTWSSGTTIQRSEESSCSYFQNEDICEDYLGCEWNNTATNYSCADRNSSKSYCESASQCTWVPEQPQYSSCSGKPQSSCDSTSGCSWNYGSTNYSYCSDLSEYSCDGESACSWVDASTNRYSCSGFSQSSCGNYSGCYWY